MFENNKYYLLESIKTFNYIYKSIPNYIKNDIEFILEVNKIYPKCILYISNKLKNDRNFILKIVKYNGKNYRYIIDIFKNDIEFILESNKTYPRSLYYVPENILSEDIILKLLKIDINNFNYIPEIFKNNKDIILNAVKIFPNFLYHEFEIIKNINCDKKFILELIKYNYCNYNYIPDIFKIDEDIIFTVIKIDKNFIINKKNIKYNKDSLLKIINKDTILKLIKYNINFFKYIPDIFKNDLDIILKIIEIDDNFIIKNYSLEYYNNIILNLIKNENNFLLNKNIILRLINNDSKIFDYIPNIYQNDKDILLKKIEMENIMSIHNLTIFFSRYFHKLKNNKYFIYKIIEYNYCSYKYIPDIFKNDKEVILHGIEYNSCIFQYISKELKKELNSDKDFMLEAIKRNRWSIIYISTKLKNDKLFLINCYNHNHCIIEYLYEKIKNNKYENLKKYERFIIDFDKISKDHNYNFDYKLLKRNEDILHIVNKKEIYNLLFNKEYYDIIYNNEIILEYFKINKNIIFLSIDDLNIENNYDLNELKLEYIKNFNNYTILFIEL